MNSSNSILRAAPIGDHVFHLDGRSTQLDPRVAAAVEEARSRAYDDGFRDGHAAGIVDATGPIQEGESRARALLASAASAAVRDIAEGMAGASRHLVGIGLDMARMIVGSAGDHWAESLPNRLVHAMSIIDDESVVVRLSPEDAVVVERLLPASVTVSVDPTLPSGDARIQGSWARADLTLEQAWRSIEAEIGDHPDG